MSFNSRSKRHPIGAVARQTGLKPDLIRAWEGRYGAVVPERTPTGRRLYSTEDIERLLLLKEATSTGRSISHVADLETSELQELLAEVRRPSLSFTSVVDHKQMRSGESRAAEIVNDCLAAVERLDGNALKDHLDLASVQLSRGELLEQVVAPLVETVGDRWREGLLRPVHEHVMTPIVRFFLTQLWTADRTPPKAPVIVIGTPPGQKHEVGALMASASASAEGWRVTYLGTDLPMSEIAAAVATTGSRVLALSLVYPPDDIGLPRELGSLRRLLGDSVQIVVGGRGVSGYGNLFEKLGIQVCCSQGEFRDCLERVRAGGRSLPPGIAAVGKH